MTAPQSNEKRILTWRERCEIHPDHQSGMVTDVMIHARMQEEINELWESHERQREALSACRDWLTDPRIGKYTYMESSDFYSDKNAMVDRLDEVLR